MGRILTRTLGTTILALLFLTGCEKHFIITEHLDKPLDRPASFVVGEITDGLPPDTEVKNKPTLEDIEKFKNYLHEELLHREFLSMRFPGQEEAEYEVVGRIYGYKKGDGVVRFLFGGLGKAKTTVELKVIDVTTGDTVFAGMFRGEISNWESSGIEMFKQVSKEFSKELEDQMKRLTDGFEG